MSLPTFSLRVSTRGNSALGFQICTHGTTFGPLESQVSFQRRTCDGAAPDHVEFCSGSEKETLSTGVAQEVAWEPRTAGSELPDHRKSLLKEKAQVRGGQSGLI